MNEATPPYQGACCWQREFAGFEDCVRKDPVKAAAAAFGLGLLIQAIPTRAVARAASSVAVTLIPPVLLALGAFKAWELCCGGRDENIIED